MREHCKLFINLVFCSFFFRKIQKLKSKNDLEDRCKDRLLDRWF